jgi:16S rRNA (guanine527-N7)-methyltransferase
VTPAKFQQLTNVSRETLTSFENYHSLTLKWQAKINLISPTTIDAVWERHIFDSAQIYVFLSVDDKVVVDLGSGAGFPGMVLALLARDSDRKTIFNLVEADSRKAAFLIEVAIATGLMNQTIRIHAVRAEKLAGGPLAGTVDVVTARALAPLPDLLGHAQPLLTPKGRCLFLKGERVDEEIAAAHKAGWSFDLVRHPSRTDAAATILEITALRRDPVLAAPQPRKL